MLRQSYFIILTVWKIKLANVGTASTTQQKKIIFFLNKFWDRENNPGIILHAILLKPK